MKRTPKRSGGVSDANLFGVSDANWLGVSDAVGASDANLLGRSEPPTFLSFAHSFDLGMWDPGKCRYQSLQHQVCPLSEQGDGVMPQ